MVDKGKKARIKIIFLLLLLLGTSQSARAQMWADLVIYNGKILTADSPDPNNFTTAQAAAVFDGKFIAVGNNEETMRYAGPSTQKIDLGGRTVIPGLVETHDHLYRYAAHLFPEGKLQVADRDSLTWTNKTDFLAQIRTLALLKKPGEWILGEPEPSGSSSVGGLVVELQRGDVTRFDLDEVAPNNLVHVRWSLSTEGLVNTKTLELLLARYPKIGGVRRDAKGVPTGRMTGLANWTLQYEFWPQIPPEDLAPYYEMEMEEVAAQGMTTVSTRLNPNQLAAWALLNARGEMPTRMAFSLESANRNPNVDATLSRLVGLQGGKGKNLWGSGDDKLWMIGLSLSNIDFTFGPAGHCVEKSYPREALNFPLWRYQFYGPNGLCTLTDPDYNDMDTLRYAAKYGFRVSAMHTGGDRGVNLYLDAVEELSKQYPDISERRWSMDHCRYVNDEQAERAKKYNIMFSCGPNFLYGGEKGDPGAYKILYGEEVAADVVVPLRRLLDHGLRTTIELDSHAIHPFLMHQVAVTRKDITGKVWGPQQRINRREALYMHTRWSSEYVMRENQLGSIEPKKAADFVVLNRDYLTVPEDEIGRIDPLLTVMGGKITYSDPEFATSQGLPQVGFRGDRSRWMRGSPDDYNKRYGNR